MSGSRAAHRYAKAILSLAIEQNKETEVNNDMVFIANTLEENQELQLFLNSPVLKSEIKKAALKEIFSSKISVISSSLLDLLLENKRITILLDVAKKYTVIFDTFKGKEVAYVTSAVALTNDLNTQILDKVKALTGKNATIENTVNPDILGGFILRIGDIQYDASVANKLQLLKRKFEDNKVATTN